MTAAGWEKSTSRLAGYAALTARYGVDVIPNWHTSRVATSGVQRVDSQQGIVEEVFPPRSWPGDGLGEQLEFALKHDGTNLALLATLFRAAPENDLLAYVRSRPTGKYARRLWFLYEFLTDRTLPLDNLKQGNYVDLLEPDAYYTVESPHRVRRQRINDNLLGDRRFCPTIRRTEILRGFEAADLPLRLRGIASRYAPMLLRRALGYLYAKETKSSFEIEHITPTSTRTERFVALLRLAQREEFCTRPQLIDLQNRIVDARFRDDGYRENQNCVGENGRPGKRAHPLRFSQAGGSGRPDGGTGSRPPAHDGRQRARGDSSRGHLLRIRLSAPVRGRQRPHPSLPGSQHPRPARIHPCRGHGPGVGHDAQEPGGL